jgi:adenylate kinase
MTSVPLVVVTGFLGAGKTTILNRVLGAQHHPPIADPPPPTTGASPSS